MGVVAGLYMYVVVVQKFTFAISSPDEFLSIMVTISSFFRLNSSKTFGGRVMDPLEALTEKIPLDFIDVSACSTASEVYRYNEMYTIITFKMRII